MDRPVAIVTGAANNIGRAIAEELASTYALVLVDRADASGVASRLPQAMAVRGGCLQCGRLPRTRSPPRSASDR